VAFAGVVVPMGAQAATTAKVPAGFSFSGSGWGHGVGLSQYGARGQALEGRTANQILTHYFSGTTVKPVKDAVDLRVNLQHRVTSLRLRGEPLGSKGGSVQVSIGSKNLTIAPRAPITLRASGRDVQVVSGTKVLLTGSPVTIRWSGTRNPGSTGSSPAVLNLVGGRSSLETSGHRYRYGQVEVRARINAKGASTMSAVNVVNLHDEYLLGIGEMPSSWPMAALQSQVVASRGFALVRYQSGVRGGCWCHVFDDTSDQVFVGYGKEVGPSGDRWRQAVRTTASSATTGRVVFYGKKVAQTFFSSSTGGRTQNSQDVWVSARPYLRSVDDRWSRDRRINPTFAAWGPRTRTQQQMAQAFALPNVSRIDLTSRYASGSLRSAKAWSATGQFAVLSGATFTRRLTLTSRWSFVTGTPYPTATKPIVPAAYKLSAIAFPASVRIPAKARISGMVLPSAASKGKRVVIQKWVNRSWKQAGSVTIASDGRFTFAAPITARGNHLYRAWKPGDQCTSKGCATRGAVSASLRLVAVQRQSVSVGSSSILVKKGARALISGKIAPATPGSRVLVQRLSKGTWKTLGSVTVRSSGRYSYRTAVYKPGRYAYRVVKPSEKCGSGTCLLQRSASKTIIVRVR